MLSQFKDDFIRLFQRSCKNCMFYRCERTKGLFERYCFINGIVLHINQEIISLDHSNHCECWLPNESLPINLLLEIEEENGRGLLKQAIGYFPEYYSTKKEVIE